MTSGFHSNNYILLSWLVGYGDFFPVTHMGRIITCMSSLYGIASLSITIITLTNSSQLSEGESQVNKIYQPVYFISLIIF